MKIIFTDSASDRWENIGYRIQEFFASPIFCSLLLQSLKSREIPFLTRTNIVGYEAKAFEEKLS